MFFGITGKSFLTGNSNWACSVVSDLSRNLRLKTSDMSMRKLFPAIYDINKRITYVVSDNAANMANLRKMAMNDVMMMRRMIMMTKRRI